MRTLFTLLLLCATYCISAQNVGIGTTSPHSSAKLDVQSQNSGMLLPRMNSVQRKAIAAPATGLLVFDTDKNAFMFWSGLEWQMLVPANANQGKPAEIMNPGHAEVNNFGYQVAVSGNFAAISAMVSSANTNAGNRVNIYEKTNSGWIQRQEIFSPDIVTSKTFGYALDMDGDYLVISDFSWKNAANVTVGKVYVYRRSNGNYTLDSGIQSISTTADGFGQSVAISVSVAHGVMIAVGMPYADAVIPARVRAGRVVLYKKNSNSWVLAQSIQPSQMQAGDYTGYSVDLNGPLLVFGAPFRQSKSGGVYIYEFQSASNNWQQASSYFLGSSSNNELLGYSVSAGNDIVAAGRPNFNSEAKGSVLLFRKQYNNNVWSTSWLYEPTNFTGQNRSSFFGKSVKIDGYYLLVGAPSSGFLSGTDFRYGGETGKAVLFKLRQAGSSGIHTSLQRLFEAEFNVVDNMFATSIGIADGNIIIGHQHAPDATSSIRGSVFFGSYEQ